MGGVLQFSRIVVVSQQRHPGVFSGEMPSLVLTVFAPAINFEISLIAISGKMIELLSSASW
jgi:hypothetical protein